MDTSQLGRTREGKGERELEACREAKLEKLGYKSLGATVSSSADPDHSRRVVRKSVTQVKPCSHACIELSLAQPFCTECQPYRVILALSTPLQYSVQGSAWTPPS